MKLKITSLEAYNKSVVKNNFGCWDWTGIINRGGYAMLYGDGKLRSAHRVSYELHKGAVAGSKVCHTCDNPVCTNPDHLFLGTQSDNIIDSTRKGHNVLAKLNPGKVLEIREHISKKVPTKTIASKYGINRQTVADIKNRRTWGYI